MDIINLSERPDMIDTLAKWHFSEWGNLYPNETQGDFKSALQACLEPVPVPSTFIAIDNDILLGSISILHKDMDIDAPWTPWLASLYVNSDYRNQGIGKLLIQHLVDNCATHSINELYLFTPASRTYYENLGWKVIKSLCYHGQEVDIMHRTL